MKKIILGIAGGMNLILFLVMMMVVKNLSQAQDSQTVAARWSSDNAISQVSCFFSVNSAVTEDSIMEFEHSIDSALVDASVTNISENPSARLWIDTYSADGKLQLSNNKTNITVNAIGIGGDFFVFHPMKLLAGNYFSGNDVMKDYCVIDQDAAWQLFGSTDVAGQIIYAGQIPLMITGVIQRPSGKLEKAAGLDGTMVFVSYETLSRYGTCNGINHYEILMPNPVKEFAYNFVKERLGGAEEECEVVENSTRYSLAARYKMIPKLGTRSMNGKAIIYPFWENVARGYEDKLIYATIFETIFLACGVVLLLVLFGIIWCGKGWTVKEKILLIKDIEERKIEKVRAKQRAKKGNPEDLIFLTEFEEEQKRKREVQKNSDKL